MSLRSLIDELAMDQALGGSPGYGDLWEYDSETPLLGRIDATDRGYRVLLFISIALAVWGWMR